MDDNTNPNTNTPEVQNAKLSGDARTFLIAFLTAVIVVIAYHLTLETIKFFNDDLSFFIKNQRCVLDFFSKMQYNKSYV